MLTALSLELITYVLEHVRPIDIVSVRRTCRALCDVTKVRQIWMNALRSAMKRRSILESTLPLDAMPLNLLEHLALGPHRLLSILQKSDGSSLRPMYIRVLAPRLTYEEKERYGIVDNDGLYDSYLESSGRYLASLSAYESFTLFTIWDLGLCGRDAIKPIARYLEPVKWKLYLDGLWPGPQGSDTFYLVSTQESSLLTPLLVLVHKVSMSESPEITFLAKLEIPVPAPFLFARISYAPDIFRLVIHYDDDEEHKHIWIWDFLHDTVAVLVATDCGYGGKEMCLHFNDCIMVAHGGSIKVYNIPPLLPRSSDWSPTECKATIVIAAPVKSPSSFFIGHEMSRTILPYFLEVTPAQITLFEVTDSNKFQGPTLPNKLPITAGCVEVKDPAFWSRDQRFSALDRCEDHLLLPSFNNAGQEYSDLTIFSADIGKNFARDAGVRLKKTVLSSTLSQRDVARRQFCAILGRVCLHTRQRLPNSPSLRSVYVLDYLGAPE
ncbi:hypothetical protein CVT26_010511 [Gymnopilus dilepis]|uniref:F-box domain-containing protein n=1 Tax=Gymnopilus dilepis TaxID=231916 RepID=A0A409Y0D3_9AGAR|nr:hypothetical protein CVT26_010511 [Gymnopilus dilepis]